MVRRTKAEKAADAKWAAWQAIKALKMRPMRLARHVQQQTARPRIVTDRGGVRHVSKAKRATPVWDLEMRRNSTRSSRRRLHRLASTGQRAS